MDEQEKAALKHQKARIRRARNAQRKLKKAKLELEALGEITDWEEEFITSVDERLEKYDAAFADRSLGGFGEALSNRQKQVLAQMRKKIRDNKRRDKKPPDANDDPAQTKWRSSFKSKSKYTPNVRQIDDDMFEDPENIHEDTEQNPKPPKNETVLKAGKLFLKIIDGGKP